MLTLLCARAAGLIHRLYPRALVAEVAQRACELQAYLDMARLVNVVPAFVLVFFGAWAAQGRSVAVLGNGCVWVLALESAGIAVASVIVNDYFDFRSGVDSLNAPSKPLPRCAPASLCGPACLCRRLGTCPHVAAAHLHDLASNQSSLSRMQRPSQKPAVGLIGGVLDTRSLYLVPVNH